MGYAGLFCWADACACDRPLQPPVSGAAAYRFFSLRTSINDPTGACRCACRWESLVILAFARVCAPSLLTPLPSPPPPRLAEEAPASWLETVVVMVGGKRPLPPPLLPLALRPWALAFSDYVCLYVFMGEYNIGTYACVRFYE